ncbi:MAG: hypothetical protein KQH57_08705 [Actinomycetales bacterium]|nr:hypothetical protein [Actinomycetales bacterium]
MNAVVVLVTLLASVVGGWFVVSGVLAMAARSKDSGEPEHGAKVEAGGPEAKASARRELRGGTWIGVLERLAVTGAVLLGHPEGIAVVVAVKGLGRYPELARNPEVSERFVIGSLASLVWAVGLGAAGLALLT